VTTNGSASSKIRVLLVEDRIPDAALGSGYPRMIDTIAELQQLVGAHVALYPTFGVGEGESAHLPAGVELIAQQLEEHLRTLRATGRSYSAVIISRPHNYERVAEIIRDYLPGIPVIYDAEALYFRRIERQSELASGRIKEQLLAKAAEMRALEESIAAEVDAVVCISADEAELLNGATKAPVVVNAPLLAKATLSHAGFRERSNVGFVAGWSAGGDSPNADGLRWFARHVWPLVLARVPGAKLLVTGDDPPREVLRFACDSIEFLGRVPNLERFYDTLRVAIVPIRYGSGVKLKTVEALQFGVPTVSTSIGAESIPSDVEGLLPVADSPDAFAALVAELLFDEKVWEQHSELLAEQGRRWNENRHVSVWPPLMASVLSSTGTKGHE
jgi:O-antigen biosynthesis protein